MELHFVKNGKFNKDYVSCKSIYKDGMTLNEIAQLLFAMNDCHKWFYRERYEHEKFTEYLNSWLKLGVKVNINKSNFIYYCSKNECPQKFQINANGDKHQPSSDLGIFMTLNDGRTDFMPHLKFISWGWNILDDKIKQEIIDKLNWSKLEK